VNSIGGTIEPGAPYGTLNMDSLTMDAASEMVIKVGGTGAGSYGRASVLLDVTLGGTFRLVGPPGPAFGRCGDVITPIYHRGDVPAGAFSVWRDLNKGPRSGWRVQATSDSLMLAGHDPSAPKLTVSKSALFTTEGGAGDRNSICLGILAPQSAVTVQPNVQNGQLAAVAAVTFDTLTCRLPQTISVAAFDDATVEPSHRDTVTYSFVSSDAAYNGPAAKVTPVTITDNDGDTDLEIVLQNAPAAVTVGSVFEIVLRVTNHGPTLSTGATLTVDPQGATNVAFEQAFGATCSVNGAGLLTCDVAGQAVGAQSTIAIVYRANAAGAVTFGATAASDQPDSNAANDSVIAAIVVS
jgi:hypothetical protein